MGKWINAPRGKDKDHIDCFIGPDHDSEQVYIVNQVDPEMKTFDEHKVILGTNSEDEARGLYLSNYAGDWNGLDSIVAMTMDEFKDWIKSGNIDVPVASPVIKACHGDMTLAKKATVPLIDRERPSVVKTRAKLKKVFKSIFRNAKQAIRKGNFIKSQSRLLMKDAGTTTEEDLAIAKILKDIELQGWSVIIEDDVEPILAAMTKDGVKQAILQIGLDADAVSDTMNEKALTYAKARGAELVGKKVVNGEIVDNPNPKWSILDTTREKIRADVSQAIEEGWSNNKLKDKLMENYSFSDERAENISRTETAYADCNGNMIGYKESGIVEGKEWLLGSEHDDDDECLIGPMMVRTGQALHGIERLYTGQLIDLDLSSGKKLTGTPNHPVLTDIGWKPLKDIKQGDNLISANWMERIGAIADYFDQVETSIQDKVASFGGRFATTSTSASDFHGDGIGSHVHTIRAASPLNNESSMAAQEIVKAFFCDRIVLTALLSRYWDSFVSLFDSFFASLRSSLSSPQSLCVAAGPQNIPGAPEPCAYGRGGDSALFRDFDGGEILREIKSGKVVSGVLRKSLSVLTVTGITVFSDTVHVYNLHTKDGFYITQNVITRNCDLNADAGVIPLDDAFPSGDDCPPGHPRCCCDFLPALAEREES